MTTTRFIPLASVFSKWIWFVTGATLLVTGSTARAFGPTLNVAYTQTTQNVQGPEPLNFTYNPIGITSPPGIPNQSITITPKLTVISAPLGVSASDAAAFVTISPATLTYSGPGQSQQITVSVSVAAGAPTGDFAYKITTSGWPATGIDPGSGQVAAIVDPGTFINMHADPPNNLAGPTVAITSPADGTVYTHTVGDPAVSVPVHIVGVAALAAPVLTLIGVLDGVDGDGVPIVSGLPIVLTLTSLGTPSADGVATLSISVPGTYTITATAVNIIGASVTQSDFIVNEVVPPPAVNINPPQNNPQYSYVRGLTSVTVPYAYVGSTLGTSATDGITALTASLTLGGSGTPTTITPATISPTGPGNLTVTASGSFVFGLGGITVSGTSTNTINATATDVYSQQATDSEIFTVTELVPVITTDIATPIDGSTIPLPPDASPLNVPFTFTSAVDHGADGATVHAIFATLKSGASDPVSVSVTASNLDTPTATGTGTFTNVLPGTYAMGATGTNDALGLSASDSATFTVTPPPPPVIVFTQPSPANGATYTTLTGYPVSIPFNIQTSNTGAYIAAQRVTLDGVAVSLTSNTANSHALVATGGGTLSIPAPVSGTSTHTLIAYGKDVYYGTYTDEVATQITFTVTVNDPVITVAINPQVAANSPYTLPAGGSLTIPFTFTGNITQGATVDTISGALGGSAVTITSYTGLGTSSTATGSGTLTITQSGSYTLTAHDTNTAAGISANASVAFVVNTSQAKPPLTVAITQPPQPSYTLVNGASPLSIPIPFVGKSNNGNTGGSVSTMSATLDGNPVTLSSTTGLNTPTSTSTATLSVSTAGSHVLVVKDTDPYSQQATASATFVVVVTNPTITITISNPPNNSVYILPCGGGCGGSSSVSIPFSFTSNITTGATIDSLSATLNGSAVSISSKSGIGTATANGSGTLTVSQSGTYTLSATATDATTGISATTSTTFTVKKAGPPTVAITSPTQTNFSTYCVSCGGLSIPFAFTATSQCGGVSKLTASLDGQCVNVTSAGLGSLNATGSGTLSVKTSGSHKLSVSATDGNGTVTSTFTFSLTVLTPTPKVTISQPTAGATFTYDYNAAAPSIPFSFTATTNAGATISSVSATLGSSCVTVSSTGIGTNTVTGTGTLKPGCAGTYTLNVTAVSCGVNATAKVTFTVKQNPPPTCTVVWQGAVCQNTAGCGGSSIPCKFQVKSTTCSGSCSIVKDTSVKLSVCEVYSNGSCSTAKTYSSSNYSVDSNNVYCLNVPTSSGNHCYRVDVYNFPNSNTPCTIGSKAFKTN